MRAIAVTEFGAAPQLLDVPKPLPGPEEVLIRLVAASPNPFDRAISDGFLRHMQHVFPLVLGVDGAGIVEGKGEEVRRFAVGEAVYGVFAHEPLGKGTFAEYIAVPEGVLIRKAPSRISLPEAAAAPTAGMSAIGLVEETGIEDGQSVLIVGASGGVGSFAVQLAAKRGARVIATARSDAERSMIELGASATIDYAQGTTAEQVAAMEPDGVDVLLDLVSDPGAFAENGELVRDDGKAVSLRYAATGPLTDRISVSNFNLREHPEAPRFLKELSDELDAGLRPVLDRELPLEETPTFLPSRISGGARGKAVILL
jgi:NADPH:quinone reductase-like Zn-dependent oxidoreductase